MQTSYFRHLKEVERFQKTKRSCSTVTLWLLVIYTPSLPWTHDSGWVSNPPKSKWSSPVKKGKDHLNHHKTIRKPSKPGVLRNADVFVLEKVQDSKPLRTPRKDWDFPHAIGFDWLETVPYVLYTFVYLKIQMTSAQSTAVEIQHGNFQRVHASFISTFSIMPRIYTESYLWKYYYFWFLIMISCIMVIGVHHHQQHREKKDFAGYTCIDNSNKQNYTCTCQSNVHDVNPFSPHVTRTCTIAVTFRPWLQFPVGGDRAKVSYNSARAEC